MWSVCCVSKEGRLGQETLKVEFPSTATSIRLPPRCPFSRPSGLSLDTHHTEPMTALKKAEATTQTCQQERQTSFLCSTGFPEHAVLLSCVTQQLVNSTYTLEVCTSCQLLLIFCLNSVSGFKPSFLLSSEACLSFADKTWRKVLISSSTWNTNTVHTCDNMLHCCCITEGLAHFTWGSPQTALLMASPNTLLPHVAPLKGEKWSSC